MQQSSSTILTDISLKGSQAKSQQNLSTIQSEPLLRLSQRLEDSGIKAYRPEVIEQAYKALKKRTDDSGSLRAQMAALRNQMLDIYKGIRSSESAIATDKAYSIVHSAAWMGISDPILNSALTRFPKAKSRPLQQAKLDLDLLVKLAIHSNLRVAKAEDAFHSLISQFSSCLKDDESKLDIIYAKAVNNSTNKRNIIRETSEFIDSIRGLDENNFKQYSKLAALFFYSKAGQRLPAQIENGLCHIHSGVQATIGSAEKQFSDIIVSSIEAATRNLAGTEQFRIEQSCFLPSTSGPYNIDFVVTAKDATGADAIFAWEINGQQHYCLGEVESSTGFDEFKHKVLRKNGICLISIKNSDLYQANQQAQIPDLINAALRHSLDNI